MMDSDIKSLAENKNNADDIPNWWGSFALYFFPLKHPELPAHWLWPY